MVTAQLCLPTVTQDARLSDVPEGAGGTATNPDSSRFHADHPKASCLSAEGRGLGDVCELEAKGCTYRWSEQAWPCLAAVICGLHWHALPAG